VWKGEDRSRSKAAGGVLTAKQARAGPAPPRRSVCAPGGAVLILGQTAFAKELPMLLDSVLYFLNARLRPASPAPRGGPARRQPPSRLCLQALEDRWLPSGYLQTNLAADQPGVALVHDPDLVDAWGLALNEGPAATFWVSSRAAGVSTVYVGDRPGVPFAK